MSGISVTEDLAGLEVRRRDGDERLGAVDDILVHPTEGSLIGLLIRTEDGKELAVSGTDWSIRGQALLVDPASFVEPTELLSSQPIGIRGARRLLGMKVITDRGNCLGYIRDRGKYLGKIRDIFVMPKEGSVVYWVGSTPVELNSFYLAGSVASSYSRSAECLEVPRRTATKYAATSLSEALRCSRH